MSETASGPAARPLQGDIGTIGSPAQPLALCRSLLARKAVVQQTPPERNQRPKMSRLEIGCR